MWLGNIDRLSDVGDTGPIDRIEALVAEARCGRREAFGSLYEEYADRIYRYIYARTGQTDLAEDLTQEVFLRAFTHISSYDSRGAPFFAWLVRIAHNLIVDHYRRAARRQAATLPDDVPSMFGDPVGIAETNLETARVVAAMKCLTPAQQQAVLLRFAAGLSVAEIAAAMGRSPGAVKALQHAAVLRLRAMLGNVPASA